MPDHAALTPPTPDLILNPLLQRIADLLDWQSAPPEGSSFDAALAFALGAACAWQSHFQSDLTLAFERAISVAQTRFGIARTRVQSHVDALSEALMAQDGAHEAQRAVFRAGWGVASEHTECWPSAQAQSSDLWQARQNPSKYASPCANERIFTPQAWAEIDAVLMATLAAEKWRN